MKKKIYVSPSILSANFANLEEDIKKVCKNNEGADFIHVDVMDGHFVPNITIGPCVVKDLKKVTPVPLDVHLMISDPEKYLLDFIKAGSDWITFHYEAVKNPINLIKKIKSYNIKAGISIKPKTPIEAIEELLHLLDIILIMSVEPGFGGQKFIENVLPKIEKLNSYSIKPPYISIDGGINDITGKLAVERGVNVLVAGSYIFKSSSPFEKVKILKNLI